MWALEPNMVHALAYMETSMEGTVGRMGHLEEETLYPSYPKKRIRSQREKNPGRRSWGQKRGNHTRPGKHLRHPPHDRDPKGNKEEREQKGHTQTSANQNKRDPGDAHRLPRIAHVLLPISGPSAKKESAAT